MPIVLLTVGQDFGLESELQDPTTGAAVLQVLRHYADQVDFGPDSALRGQEPDHRYTNQYDTAFSHAWGGPIRHISIPRPWPEQNRPPGDSPQRIRDATVVGFRTACQFARTLDGSVTPPRICVLLGHGDVRPLNAYVDLAPFATLRVDIPFMETMGERRSRSDFTHLSPQENAFVEIGEALRTARVDRVDLYSCIIGLTQSGQTLLDWFQYLWGVPVRGLRGMLVVEEDDDRRVASVHVDPHGSCFGLDWGAAGYPLPAPSYGRQSFTDQLIEGPGFWAQSHHRGRPPPRPLP